MFSFLTSRIASVIDRIAGSKELTESVIDQSLVEIKNALLDADVPVVTLDAFLQQVRASAIGVKRQKSLKPAEQFVKIVYDELVRFLSIGTSFKGFRLPQIILMMGLQGSGKTTTIGKLAHYFMTDPGHKISPTHIACASLDFQRPAAREQLRYIAHSLGITYHDTHAQDPIAAAHEITAHAQNAQVFFVDTAGRLQVDNTLLDQLNMIKQIIHPTTSLLVLDAMTGQMSLAVGKQFEVAVGYDFVVMSKLDSDARGGAAFACGYELKKRVIFSGTGEKVYQFERFHPERIASRILGMGDLQTLLENAQQKIKKEDQERAAQAFAKGTFTLEDFRLQITMLNSMGPLKKIMEYMPMAGVGKGLSQEQIEQGQVEIKRFHAIINSMTLKERCQPAILDASRKQRIARGAGVDVTTVNMLLQRFSQVQQYAKLLKNFNGFKQIFR